MDTVGILWKVPETGGDPGPMTCGDGRLVVPRLWTTGSRLEILGDERPAHEACGSPDGAGDWG